MTRPSKTALGVTTWVIRRRPGPLHPLHQLLESLVTFFSAVSLGLMLALLLASCSSRRLEAAPEQYGGRGSPDRDRRSVNGSGEAGRLAVCDLVDQRVDRFFQ